jgi:hypothetical protein
MGLPIQSAADAWLHTLETPRSGSAGLGAVSDGAGPRAPRV